MLDAERSTSRYLSDSGVFVRGKSLFLRESETGLGVPILKGADILGVIVIYRHEVRPFTNNQIALVGNLR